jgi:uncharacterized protein YjbI with pentapeptide repeats
MQTDFARRMFALGTNRKNNDFLMVRANAREPGHTPNPFELGAKHSWVPIIGDVVWKISEEDEEKGYFAYSFRIDDRRQVGYIRVPDYNQSEDAIDVFEQLILRFQDTTEALIIDQVNNPGGSMFQMYALLSILTDRPLPVPLHQITINDDAVAVAADVIANADEEPPERVAYSRLVLSEKAAGRGTGERLSYPLYLEGVERVLPAKNHYTKKIVVLINELTFSAGEFLAAMLQDSRIATLFGFETAGAGGCVKKFVLPSSRRLLIESINLTWTIARRTNGDTLEDNGVRPDVEYETTVEDLESTDPLRRGVVRDADKYEISGFQGYRKALLHTLTTIMNEDSTPDQTRKVSVWRPSEAQLKDILEAMQDSKLAKGRRADLSGADLTGIELASANFAVATLAGAQLRGANLRNARLGWANLRDVNMSCSDLRGADLSGAYLSGANLSGANLGRADCKGAIMNDADLSNADLTDANLLDVYLQGANLSGTDLRTAIGLSADQLHLACAARENPTKLPLEFNPPRPKSS